MLKVYRARVNNKNYYFEAIDYAKAYEIARALEIVHSAKEWGVILVEHDQSKLEYGTQSRSNVIQFKKKGA